MKKIFYYSFAALIISVGVGGCATQPQPESKQSLNGVEKVSQVLLRLKNTSHENYTIAAGDIFLPISETNNIKTFEDITTILEEKGYVVDIVANKYRLDRPKIIEVHEKGKYAGSLSTIPYSPLKNKTFSEVMLDVGMLIKFNIIMDPEVLAESKVATIPASIFRGNTVADYLSFCEKAYDFHVEIDTKTATINVRKYKTVIINVLAEKTKITNDANIFLSDDINEKRIKQFVSENGKMYINGTPSAIAKATRYAEEINALNRNKVIISFDGKKSLSAALMEISSSKKMVFSLIDGDFVPEKDSGVWFESYSDIDEYLRKNYNKKLVKVNEKDNDRDGINESISFISKPIHGIPLSTPTTVYNFFKQLENIDGNEYIIEGDANIPITKAVIDDYEHLRAYLWASAGIKITLNDAGVGFPKFIRVEQ